MNIKFSPPDIKECEIEEVNKVLKSGWITTGPKTLEFENSISEYLGTKKTIALNSASSCMEMCLHLLGIKEGDEIITSAYTYTASAACAHHLGAKVILCDVKKDSYEMDYDKLESLITKKTKAIIPVDIAGKICDYKKIYNILENKNNIEFSNDIQEYYNRPVVLADAAHSFGADMNNKRSGNFADFTSFSFHAVKNLTCAEGGALTWNNEFNDYYKQLKLLSLNGQTKSALDKTKLGSWEYDIEFIGYKCNITDIASVIGLAQLRRYDDILKRRKEIITYYNDKISNYAQVIDHYNENSNSSGHLYLTRPYNIKTEEERNTLIEKMAEKGVPCNVHYKPLPMFTGYKKLGFDINNYKNSYNQYKNEITLPLHSLLTDAEVEYIVEKYLEIIKK